MQPVLVNTGEQIMEMLLIGIGIAAVAIILLIILFVMRKKKKKDDK
ncbi:GGIII-like transmembrane region-containing protein [Culicoidibacter larvae]|uniref:LPXTG cell wall anchor domain-containing protein n=1 Tax=Culicoidibacter larvae TaxID=2579976 RepID=A0A5R8QHI4_9FIRM|nr:GGIII-like transmembrane region-containing protein [Culicoidibacter larvae]TLG77501.1 LPXTG cell wall anchor domain-containing protein [Culicoidibacter larvae]